MKGGTIRPILRISTLHIITYGATSGPRESGSQLFASFHDVKRWDDNEEEDDKSQQTTWALRRWAKLKKNPVHREQMRQKTPHK
jgi:hypothetical protein